MKKIKPPHPATNKTRNDKLQYKVFVALVVFYILYQVFVEGKTIGGDWRYNIFILALPTLTGIITLAICMRVYLLAAYRGNKGFFLKITLTGFYIIQGFFISYLSIGMLADVIWDNINKQAAYNNATEVVNCEIDSFTRGKHPKVYFLFQNRLESLNISDSFKTGYNDKNAKYQVELEINKGIWNYYLVKSYRIIKR